MPAHEVGNLPNLDALKTHRAQEPEAPPPVPSTRRRHPRGPRDGGHGGEAPHTFGGVAEAGGASGNADAVTKDGGGTVAADYFALRYAAPLSAVQVAASSLFAGMLAQTPLNGASPASQSVPVVMRAGQAYGVSVEMTNTGSTTWTSGEGYRLGSRNPQDNLTWGASRVNLTGAVTPGQSALFSFTVAAPATPGVYNFQWRMVRDGFEWFGQSSQNVSVNVTADGGYTPPPAGSVVISEFRARGPAGASDEFVELYNTTASPVTVSTADGSAGWALVGAGGQTKFVVPAGSVIPARGRYLAANQAYSLASHAAPDLAYTADIADNSGIALFRTAAPANFTQANRLDAAGFAGLADALYYEGAGLASVSTSVGAGDGQFSFFRRLGSGVPADTGSNAADFVPVSTTGCVGHVSGTPPACTGTAVPLGAPGPENAQSPAQRNGGIATSLLDLAASSSSPPNRDRDASAVGPNAANGTLTIRRKYTNNTGAAVTRLRFRVVSVTTLNNRAATQADVRAISSPNATVVLTNGQAVAVKGTTLEEPPTQAAGGGLNSTLSAPAVTLLAPLAPGNSINLQFVLGVEVPGTFAFGLNIEAETAGGPAAPASADDISTARIDPANRTGGAGVDLLSGNYNWTLPLVSLKGRAGLDLGLSLAYNSRVWTRAGASVAFDADGGFPSPGFRLGFPSVEPRFTNTQTGRRAYLLVTPNGDRVELRETPAAGLYESADSTYLQLYEAGGGLTLRPPDGSQMTFLQINGAYVCTRVKDRHGNHIDAAYDSAGQLRTVTDTLGRVLTFNYDQFQNLVSITQQRWNAKPLLPPSQQYETRQLATFGWGELTVDANFAGLARAGLQDGSTIPVLTQVGLPDGSLYRFDYTPWAQVNRITRYTPASDTPPPSPAFPQDYAARSSVSYLLRGDDGAESDCPRVLAVSASAENWIGGQQAVTGYAYDPAGLWGEATLPDATRFRESFGAGWQRGLTVKTENFAAGDAPTEPRKRTTTYWEQNDQSLAYALNPRVTRTVVEDAEGNARQTFYEYDAAPQATLQTKISAAEPGGRVALPAVIGEARGDGSVLRRTRVSYNLAEAYLSRRVVGLVAERAVYGEGDVLASKTSYLYDQPDEPGLQYLQESNPNPAQSPTVQHDASYGLAFVQGRANLNVVRRWDATDPGNAAKAVSHKAGYNTHGSAVLSVDPGGHRASASYADSFTEPAKNGGRFAYPTLATDADGYSSRAAYNFDLGAVTSTQTPMPDQTAANVFAPAQIVLYDKAGRVTRVENTFNGAYTRRVYPASLTSVQTFTLLKDGVPAVEALSSEVFDGAGRVVAASRTMAAEGRYSGRKFVYGLMGRLVNQSNPTETTGEAGWPAAGDDDPANGGAGWVYGAQEYDWKGRPTLTTHQDGATEEITYASSCGCAGGVTTFRDAAGRRSRSYSDAFGRVVKMEVLQGGGVYSTTATAYNALNQPTLVRSHQGDLSGPYQEASFEYDGLARPLKKKSPAQSAPTEYAYDEDGSVREITDARGVKTQITYNGRHLPLTVAYIRGATSVPTTVGAAAVGTTPVAHAPAVTYAYDAAANRKAMSTEGGAGGGVAYAYDALSRMTSETRHFPGNPAAYTLNYQYTAANALEKVTDSAANTSFTYAFDPAGQVSGVTGDGFAHTGTFADQMKYRAWGALKSASHGNSTSLSLSYNVRGLPAVYALGGVKSSAAGPARTEGSSFLYHEDGRVKFAGDLSATNGPHDRAYGFDHLGRLAAAYSDADARNFRDGVASDTGSGPFRQSYTHDAWDNVTGFSGRYWSLADSAAAVYDTRGRNEAWEYEAAGRLVSRREPSPNGLPYAPARAAFDAAGRQVSVSQTASRRSLNPNSTVVFTTATTRAEIYDGDGQVVKKVTTSQLNGNAPTSDTSYFLRSTVMGGRVISRYDGAGARRESYVYAGSETVAEEVRRPDGSRTTLWRHANPLTGDQLTTDWQGVATAATKLDPAGVDVGDSDPFAAVGGEEDPGGGGGIGQSSIDDKVAQLIPGYGGPQVKLDGFITSPLLGLGVLARNAGAVCTRASCEPTFVTYQGRRELALWGRTDDGYEGYMPVSAHYRGDGNFSPSSFVADPHHGTRDTDFSLLNRTGNNEQWLASSNAHFQPQQAARPSYTQDACGEMAANAQRIADEALRSTGGNAKKALRKFDNDFGKFYAGYPMNSGLNMARLRSSGGGGPNRQSPSFLWGQTGFRREFMETDSTGNVLEGHHDQTHHFAAMFSGGINRYWIETAIHNRGDNDGDQRLTNAAYDLGAALRGDANKLRQIGNLIRNAICDQRGR